MISTIILTFNEEADLPACLKALDWCDDLHVLDSGSTDQTVAIASSFGARVKQHHFESFGKQRNFALSNLPLKHDWILFLDADEIASPEFRDALLAATGAAAETTAGFYCCWKMILEDRWLKRCDNYPKWQFRVLRKGRADFTDFGHGQKEGLVQGAIEYIKDPYLHYGFSKGWSHWIARHNRYSSDEAKARLAKRPPFRSVFDKNSSKRNPAIKSWITAVPGWPLLRFSYSYFLRLGFLEGRPGFIYCVNMAYYEFLIKIKMREIRRGKNRI